MRGGSVKAKYVEIPTIVLEMTLEEAEIMQCLMTGIVNTTETQSEVSGRWASAVYHTLCQATVNSNKTYEDYFLGKIQPAIKLSGRK